MRARDAAFVGQQQSDQLTPGRFPDQRRLANEIARTRKIDGPGETGFERGNGFVHVLPVKVHSGFEAQRVARTESGRLDTHGVKRMP